MNYQVLHDQGRIMCYIGNTLPNQMYHNHYSKHRPSELLRFEEVLEKDSSWFQERQFMVANTDVSFRRQVVEGLAKFSPHYFSLVSNNTTVGVDTKIGHNVVINDFNFLWDNVVIGDHCTITTHCTISHGTVIGNFCFIAPYSYICFTTLGQGVIVGLRSSFIAKPDALVQVADWTNFVMDSRVNMSIVKSGTYRGHKLIAQETSLDKKIL
jgi:acetyltransferase-like isoleucine patch superfamily enzyme